MLRFLKMPFIKHQLRNCSRMICDALIDLFKRYKIQNCGSQTLFFLKQIADNDKLIPKFLTT